MLLEVKLQKGSIKNFLSPAVTLYKSFRGLPVRDSSTKFHYKDLILERSYLFNVSQLFFFFFVINAQGKCYFFADRNGSEKVGRWHFVEGRDTGTHI